MPNDQRTRGMRPDMSNVRTIQQYAAQAISRVELTRAAAQAAMEKATRPDVREIAGYALMEAKAVISCLKELGAPVPPWGRTPDRRWRPSRTPPGATPSTGPTSRPSARTTPSCAT